MGDLPAVRINAVPLFTNGIDYCGTVYIKKNIIGNKWSNKVYVAVFICLTIRTVHLELTSDLNTEAVIVASLKRFIARRGKCRRIYSDNGTNFVGDNNELQDLQQLLNTKQHQELVHTFLSNKGIEWHFTAP